jgi:hypothetical protein
MIYVIISKEHVYQKSNLFDFQPNWRPRRSAAPLYGMKSDFVKGRQQLLEPFSRS